MTTEQIPNTFDVQHAAREALVKWQSGEKNNAQGTALGVVAIFHAAETMTFHCVVMEKGKETTHHDFDFSEIVNKPRKPDGSMDKRLSSAQYRAFVLKVFNLEDTTAAQRQNIDRCIKLVAQLSSKGVSLEDVSISKRGFLEVPYVLMHDQPDTEKASEREIKTYDRAVANGETEVLDGTEGMSIANLQRRTAPKEERTTRVHADKATQLVASVRFVNSVLIALLDKDGEIKGEYAAPNNELRSQMWELQQRLSTYFQADPYEEKQTKRKSA